jgi:hypothetical protein
VLKDGKQLPDDAIDGVTYSHYSGTLDLRDLLGKVPDDVFKPGVKQLTNQLFQPAKVEVWIDPDSGFPRRMQMEMTITVASSSVDSKMVMDYTGWNQAVDIPALPTDAKPYSELTGGLTPEDLTYIVQYSSAITTLSNHLQRLDDLPDSGDAVLTKDQHDEAEAVIADFYKDAAVIVALSPTPRFQPSFDVVVNALRDFSSAFDIAKRELDSGEKGDEAKATAALQEGSDLFAKAGDLFQEELHPTAP